MFKEKLKKFLIRQFVSPQSFLRAVENGRLHDVQRYIEAHRGKNTAINQTNPKGAWAIQEAAMNGHTAIVQVLLDEGVSASKQPQFGLGNSPLIIAVLMKHWATVTVLLDAKASLNDVDQFGETALEVAKFIHSEDFFKSLIQKAQMPKTETKLIAKSTEVEIPKEFECIITYETMKDPVICTLDLQHYDREAITSWLITNKTSPFNRQKMDDEQNVEEILIPDDILAGKIREFKQEHPELFSNNSSERQRIAL